MTPQHLLVLGNPAARHLKLLSSLPAGTSVAVAADAAQAASHAARATAVLCDMGRSDLLEGIIGQTPQLRWVHSLSAGVETLMFPGMLAHPLTLTNGRGMFKRSLAEFVIAGCLFFAYLAAAGLSNLTVGGAEMAFSSSTVKLGFGL